MTITIDANVGETLAPAPASAKPRLKAQEAFDTYLGQGHHRPSPIPSAVRVQLGLLTIPLGGPSPYPGEGYTAKDRLVWAFSVPVDDCPRSEILDPTSTPSPEPGVEWDFLDANTGEYVEGTCQVIVGYPSSAK